jgi:hypothetical protein
LIIHLLFLIYFKGNSSYRHWRGEAYGFVPHYITCFKRSHKFPKQDFLDHSLFLWLLDSDLAIKNSFSHRVGKEGLSFPENFESSYPQSVLKVGMILHEATGVLAARREIDPDQFSAILEKPGL